MATTVTWNLKNATAIDNYPLKNADNTETLMDGVITSAVLECIVTDGTTTAKHPFVNVPFAAPVPDAFAPLDTLEKATVLEWALDQIPTPVKENIERALTIKISATAPVARTVFND